MTMQFQRFGGPTVVFGVGGVTFITDPTFDPPGQYPLGSRVLTKTEPAAGTPDDAGAVDVVLLSHDQHPDNLDTLGRAFAASVPVVLSTPAAAARLGGQVTGLEPWSHTDLPRPGGDGHVRVTAVPAQHGPDGTEHLTGPVTGFVLHGDGLPTVYVSGDNASLDVVAAVAERFPSVDVAILFGGRARTALLGDADLTLGATGMLAAARLLDAKTVVPVHVDSWAHFTEGITDVRAAFETAGSARLLR
ncbi:MBL fold metallo-hydrolase [Dactylosporangium maewongense]|uniref:MBL fold metallo-hydrolase n=1 Tax=Dactylosporangium maewongense TaxID=634393 RepID=A0ABN2ASN2_9ACTN